MDIDFNEINYLSDPDLLTLKADFNQFLLSLTGPTVIDISGKDPSRTRVITTLLHGNEPSGLIALHRWLTEDSKCPTPETNIRIIIASIEAASAHPLFSNRYITGGLDLNRCFGSTQNTSYYQRANLITHAINEVSPEAVVDLHNTSGYGPAFAVSPIITTDGLSLASYFCQTMILSSFRLGALMEQNFNCPTITIECGGSNDEQSHEVAFEGIKRISSHLDITSSHQQKTVEVIYRPLRLKTKPDVNLDYAAHDEGYAGVTLKSTIEQFNYGSAIQGQMLGWLDERGLDNLELLDDKKNNVLNDYFDTRDNQLICAVNIRIFMATTNKKIAQNDCLFYVVKSPTGEPYS
ncbi:succinylglutamate desuccinylase/aspartoacylase family protein [Colwelliaceae bacterium 6471]